MRGWYSAFAHAKEGYLIAPPAAFDPARLAAYETAVWHAYYARDWGHVLWLMLLLNRQQFGMA